MTFIDHRSLMTDGPRLNGLFASVGLWVSGSHDPGEIACEIACNLIDAICSHAICRHAICAVVAAGDEATSESHKGMHLAPVDGSSVDFFSFRSHSIFPALPRLFSS